MHSIRLWKCLFDENDVRSNGVLGTYSDFRWEGKDFTVRGLENYIFSSSGEMNRQRDLYNVAVLQAPYDADGMLAHVCDMSRASLQRAQNYALHDAIDSYDDCASAPVSHQIRDMGHRFQCGSSPPRSPSSILSIDTFHQSVEPMHAPHVDITSIREMNKRLIKKHLNDSAHQDLSPVQKKIKRRSSTSGSYVLAHNLTYPERRRSTSFLANDYRQPVSLQIQNISSIDRQRRRPSMADDFNQHMQFCNRLLNDLPIVDHCPYRRDSLSLAGSGLNKVTDQLESISGQSHRGYLGIDDEYLMQRQLRRDSLCGSQRGLFAGFDPDIKASSISSIPVHVPCLSSSTMKPPTKAFDNDDRSLLQQMLLERKQSSLNDSALNEYTGYIRSYSRLRRDSLGGNFGM
jgi:hypothetical protein